MSQPKSLTGPRLAFHSVGNVRPRRKRTDKDPNKVAGRFYSQALVGSRWLYISDTQAPCIRRVVDRDNSGVGLTMPNQPSKIGWLNWPTLEGLLPSKMDKVLGLQGIRMASDYAGGWRYYALVPVTVAESDLDTWLENIKRLIETPF